MTGIRIQGNENRFETAEACLATCGRSGKTSRIIRIEPESGHQGVTTLPIRLTAANPIAKARSIQSEDGFEKASTLPIRLDGSNAIETKEEVEINRPSQCLQPKKTGPCRGLATFYFFDVNKQKCVAFNYGGCEVLNFLDFEIRDFVGRHLIKRYEFQFDREMITGSKRWTSVDKHVMMLRQKVKKKKEFLSKWCQNVTILGFLISINS